MSIRHIRILLLVDLSNNITITYSFIGCVEVLPTFVVFEGVWSCTAKHAEIE